jgi:hypothetical protein
MSQDIYEVYPVKYATREGTRSGNFIGGDPHDAPMPMDYFIWLIRNAERTSSWTQASTRPRHGSASARS